MENAGRPLSKYPSADDALAAGSTLGYGTGNEPFIEGKAGRVFTKPVSKGGASVADATNRPDKKGDVFDRSVIGEAFGQAEIAKGRSAIATLGYDPNKIVTDTKTGRMTIGGAFDANTDRIMWNATEPDSASTLMHESIHRGFEELRKKSPEAKQLLDSTISEESLVRYLMATKMGDPENREDWPGGIVERNEALGLVKKFPMVAKKLDRLEEIAAELHKDQRPRGPR